MKTIYLLRHAKAEQGGASTIDRDRRLTNQGLEDARAASVFFHKKQWPVDFVLCSPAIRTRETALAINQGQKPSLAIDYPDMLYLASAGDMLRILQHLPDNLSSILLVGHNPGIHQCSIMLAGSGERTALEDMEIKFPPCALAVLSCPVDRWDMLAPHCGHLVGYWDQY